MSSDERDVQRRTVDRYVPRDREVNKPHKIFIGDNAFSSFHDATMDGVEEGAVVSFDFEAAPAPPRDVRIRRQVALKAAVEHHKQETAEPEDVTETSDVFNEWLKGGDDQ